MADLVSGTPLYIYNGGQDFWIPALGARNLYDEQCGYGVAAVYRQVPGEHFLGEALGNSGAFEWVDARLRGEPRRRSAEAAAPPVRLFGSWNYRKGARVRSA